MFSCIVFARESVLILTSHSPSQVNGGIENTLEKEVVQYDYYSSYFDIFVSIPCSTSHFRYDESVTSRPISSE